VIGVLWISSASGSRTTEVDLSQIDLVADHLTPWRACNRTMRLLAGDATFVLSHSGHIASLDQPAWQPQGALLVRRPAARRPSIWVERASRVQGSW